MAARSSDPKHAGRHEWNSFEDYRRVNENKLATSPYILDSEVAFVEIDDEGDFFIRMDATVRFPEDVILEVTKLFETSRRGPGRGRLYVRAISYRYNAWIEARHNILRYDNGDDPHDYHGHHFDLTTGDETERWSMPRDDFPLFSEVIEEIAAIMRFDR